MNAAGRTALVTGSAHRIGRALALALMESGAHVAVHYNDSAEAAEETVRTLTASGGLAKAFRADLADAEQVGGLHRDVVSWMGPVEILVNNAALFGLGDMAASSVEEWDRCMSVNVRAPWLLAREMRVALPSGSQGKIVNIGDSRTARPDRFVYGASKAALHGLTASLANALAPVIQVNEIALGAILPPADSPRGQPRKEDRQDIGLIRRMGTLNEVTQTLMWLIENDFVTGETIHVDGGRHVRQIWPAAQGRRSR